MDLGQEARDQGSSSTALITPVLSADPTMAPSYLRPWASLLLADVALLGLLQGSLGNLLPPGLPGLWLEGTLRLGVLWGLLKVGGLLGLVGTLLPLLCLATPLFFSLRALVGDTVSTPAVRVASASWGWLLAGYGAAALSRAVWAVLSPAEAQEKEPGQENNRALMMRLLKLSRPDLPFLIAAFFFLVMAVLGERERPPAVRGRWEEGLARAQPPYLSCSFRGDVNPSLFGSCD